MIEPAATPGPTDVWIDTDPSVGLPFHEADDAFALVQAFHSPELRVRGLSTSYGNAAVAATTRIARELADNFGKCAAIGSADVHAGAGAPTDLGQSTAALEALRDALAERPLTYLALAPLTNLATLLRRHPESAGRIQRVIFVGGRTPGMHFRAGGWNPYEFTDGNFHKDHTAVAAVLASPLPLALTPVELALQLPLLPAELDRLGCEGGAAGRYLATRGRGWMRGWLWGFGTVGAMVFDCLAVLAATHPHLLAWEHRQVSISHDAPERERIPARQVHLLARPDFTGPAGREATFYTRPLPGAREALLARLLGRC